MKFKAAPSMALSESGGTTRRRTRDSRHFEDDECGLGRVGNPWTLCDRPISEYFKEF